MNNIVNILILAFFTFNCIAQVDVNCPVTITPDTDCPIGGINSYDVEIYALGTAQDTTSKPGISPAGTLLATANNSNPNAPILLTNETAVDIASSISGTYTNMIVDISTLFEDIQICVRVTDSCGESVPDCDDVYALLPPPSYCGTLDVQVFLEGPFDGVSNMTTYLNDFGLLPGEDPCLSGNPICFIFVPTPIGQPYTGPPWNHSGTEGDIYGDPATGGTTAYPATVTDWVLLSVREATISAANEIWKCAALLHNDGTVEIPSSCPCLNINDAEEYHIIVEHRNHLSVASTAVTPAGGGISFDFTSNDSWKLGIGSPQEVSQKVIGGTFTMYTANPEQVSGRTDINSGDNSVWLLDNGTVFKYMYGDFNLNADTNSADRALWLNNNGLFNLIPF